MNKIIFIMLILSTKIYAQQTAELKEEKSAPQISQEMVNEWITDLQKKGYQLSDEVAKNLQTGKIHIQNQAQNAEKKTKATIAELDFSEIEKKAENGMTHFFNEANHFYVKKSKQTEQYLKTLTKNDIIPILEEAQEKAIPLYDSLKQQVSDQINSISEEDRALMNRLQQMTYQDLVYTTLDQGSEIILNCSAAVIYQQTENAKVKSTIIKKLYGNDVIIEDIVSKWEQVLLQEQDLNAQLGNEEIECIKAIRTSKIIYDEHYQRATRSYQEKNQKSDN